MIYAVNKRTKAHRALGTVAMAENEWELVQADPDGWIEWQGGECPLPDDAGVRVKTNIGIRGCGRAYEFRWARQSRHGDIIAYRPILDADTKPEPPAWDGEGLPPVGCECEYDDCQHGWVRTRILAHHPNGSCAWHESVEADGFVDETSYSTDSAGAFRPIRSEEDRAVEEMYEAATGDPLEGDEMDDADAVSVCRELYRAGYRKTGDT